MLHSMIRAAFAVAATLALMVAGTSDAQAAFISLSPVSASFDSTVGPGPGNGSTFEIFINVETGELVDAVQATLDFSGLDITIFGTGGGSVGNAGDTDPPTGDWTSSASAAPGGIWTAFGSISVGEPLSCGGFCTFNREALGPGQYLFGSITFAANGTNLSPGLSIIPVINAISNVSLSGSPSLAITITPEGAASEPITLSLLGLGLAGLAFVRRSA